jgi:2,3-bisphosphoglycerate-dependent phosphoglycerate mutase
MGLTAGHTRLCLVRHGETAWNIERRLQGHLDIPLNDAGQLQAQRTAARLAQYRFAALYSSDLARAWDTGKAAATQASPALEPAALPALRERHYGAFQGLTYDEVQRRFEIDYTRFTARELDFALPGGGESLRAFAARVSGALGRIAERHAGTQVLIVTHGGVLDIAHRLAAGKTLEAARDFTIPNAALNWIAFDTGAWQLLEWADQRHLKHARDELPNG